MSNDNHGTRFANFVPGMIKVVGDTQTENVMFDLPNGREAAVQIRTQLEEPEARARHREEFLSTVYPPSLTESLEREVARMTDRWNDFTGYDKQGKPLMRVQGRAREVLEMQLANRRSALVLAQRQRDLAERVQAEAKRANAEEERLLDKASQEFAKEMMDRDEIERRAKLIVARAGVRN